MKTIKLLIIVGVIMCLTTPELYDTTEYAKCEKICNYYSVASFATCVITKCYIPMCVMFSRITGYSCQKKCSKTHDSVKIKPFGIKPVRGIKGKKIKNITDILKKERAFI